jgi:hypothetical protein
METIAVRRLAEEHCWERYDSRAVQALKAYTRVQRFVCLGDVLAFEVESVPLLGIMQTGSASDSTLQRKLVYMKVVELSSNKDAASHEADVRTPFFSS